MQEAGKAAAGIWRRTTEQGGMQLQGTSFAGADGQSNAALETISGRSANSVRTHFHSAKMQWEQIHTLATDVDSVKESGSLI